PAGQARSWRFQLCGMWPLWLRLVGLVDRSGRAMTPGWIQVTTGIRWNDVELVGKPDKPKCEA
ncbi:MAG: hypothetical protein EB073_08815, partial [Burkholderiaceae bacterium]|nr:hypothetical protein [Burkholderiaceae bacterium]